VLAEFKRRSGDVWVDLRQADEMEGRSFVDGFLDTEPNHLGEDFRRALFEHTGGHPLFTVEVLRAMQERGDLVQDAEGRWVEGPSLDWERLPTRVEAVIAERIGRLDEELRDVLAVTSVEGEQFTAQVVAQVQDTPEREMLQALSKELAGRAEKAVEYSLRAGDQARLAYANEEAITYFHRALVLLDELPLTLSRKDWRLEALRGLGQVYYGMGKLAEAEERLREAITLGREIGLAPRDLVRLYYWLGETLWWQDRYDDRIRIGEEGLALLGDDAASAEAALMNQHVALGHWHKRDMERYRELTYRTAQFIQRLPYAEELRPAYVQIAVAYKDDKDVEEAMKWFQALEKRATPHHDLRALGDVNGWTGQTLAATGDSHGAISRYQQALELSTRAGDTKNESQFLAFMGEIFLWLGDIQRAEEYARRGLETAEATGNKRHLPAEYRVVGQICLSQGAGKRAMSAFQKATQLLRETRYRGEEGAETTCALGRGYLAQGDRAEALNRFQEAVALVGPEALKREPSSWFFFYFASLSGLRIIPSAVSGLEEAYEDPEAFRFFCRRFQEECSVGDLAFVQWFLEPADVRAVRESPLHHDEFATPLSPDWEWQDVFHDCAFTVQNGLEIHAANGQDLWHINWSAPRILRPASPVLSEVEGGDLAVQAMCAPVSDERPAVGGLLLWKSKENYLRLDKGVAGEREILFGGCLANQDVVIGRGRLPAHQQIDRSAHQQGWVYLRLERVGDQVEALCSADGESWFTVGQVPFPVEDLRG